MATGSLLDSLAFLFEELWVLLGLSNLPRFLILCDEEVVPVDSPEVAGVGDFSARVQSGGVSLLIR